MNEKTPVRIKAKIRKEDDPLRLTNLSKLAELNEKYPHDPNVRGFFNQINEDPAKFEEACKNIGKETIKLPDVEWRSKPRKLRGRFRALQVWNRKRNPSLIPSVLKCEKIAMREAFGTPISEEINPKEFFAETEEEALEKVEKEMEKDLYGEEDIDKDEYGEE